MKCLKYGIALILGVLLLLVTISSAFAVWEDGSYCNINNEVCICNAGQNCLIKSPVVSDNISGVILYEKVCTAQSWLINNGSKVINQAMTNLSDGTKTFEINTNVPGTYLFTMNCSSPGYPRTWTGYYRVPVGKATEINCTHSLNPYLKPFGKIWWTCYLDQAEPLECRSYVNYLGRVIQTNPQREIVDDVGIIDTFKTDNGIVPVYFTSKDLRDNISVTFGVRCGGLEYKSNITPSFKSPEVIMERSVWTFNNVGFIVGLGFFCLAILILAVLIWRFSKDEFS